MTNRRIAALFNSLVLSMSSGGAAHAQLQSPPPSQNAIISVSAGQAVHISRPPPFPASREDEDEEQVKKKKRFNYWDIAAETLLTGNADRAVQNLWGHNKVETQIHGDGLLVIDKKNNEVFCYSARPELINRLLEIAIKQIQDPETGGLDPWSDMLFIDCPTPGTKAIIRGILDSRSIYYVFRDEFEADPTKFAGQFYHANRKRRDALLMNGTKFLNEYYLWIEKPGTENGNNLGRTAPGEIIDDRVCFNPVKTPVSRWPKLSAKGVVWPAEEDLRAWLREPSLIAAFNTGCNIFDRSNPNYQKNPIARPVRLDNLKTFDDVVQAYAIIQEACRQDRTHRRADILERNMGIVMPISFNMYDGKFTFPGAQPSPQQMQQAQAAAQQNDGTPPWLQELLQRNTDTMSSVLQALNGVAQLLNPNRSPQTRGLGGGPI